MFVPVLQFLVIMASGDGLFLRSVLALFTTGFWQEETGIYVDFFPSWIAVHAGGPPEMTALQKKTSRSFWLTVHTLWTSFPLEMSSLASTARWRSYQATKALG